MKLVRFGTDQVGVLNEAGDEVTDVTAALPHHDPGLGANYFVRMCQDFADIRPDLERLLETAEAVPLTDVSLRSPVLNPSKIVATASNYEAHIAEMRPPGTDIEKLDMRSFFDVFLKAPSSITDPGAEVGLPDVPGEVHYEGELAFVMGREAKDVRIEEALDHVLGYTIILDITERGKGDRSRRKSYDGFTPVGPCLVTREELPSWEELEIEVYRNGELRQDVKGGEMIHPIPEIIARASRVMTLRPGDLVATGSPPGVGQVLPGDHVSARISGVGALEVTFAAASGA